MSCIGSLQPPNYTPGRAVHGDLYLGIITVIMTKRLPYKRGLHTGGFLRNLYGCNDSESNDAATRPQWLSDFTSIDPRSPEPIQSFFI